MTCNNSLFWTFLKFNAIIAKCQFETINIFGNPKTWMTCNNSLFWTFLKFNAIIAKCQFETINIFSNPKTLRFKSTATMTVKGGVRFDDYTWGGVQEVTSSNCLDYGRVACAWVVTRVGSIHFVFNLNSLTFKKINSNLLTLKKLNSYSKSLFTLPKLISNVFLL